MSELSNGSKKHTSKSRETIPLYFIPDFYNLGNQNHITFKGKSAGICIVFLLIISHIDNLFSIWHKSLLCLKYSLQTPLFMPYFQTIPPVSKRKQHKKWLQISFLTAEEKGGEGVEKACLSRPPLSRKPWPAGQYS
jgi:hypothetical protein